MFAVSSDVWPKGFHEVLHACLPRQAMICVPSFIRCSKLKRYPLSIQVTNVMFFVSERFSKAIFCYRHMHLPPMAFGVPHNCIVSHFLGHTQHIIVSMSLGSSHASSSCQTRVNMLATSIRHRLISRSLLGRCDHIGRASACPLLRNITLVVPHC